MTRFAPIRRVLTAALVVLATGCTRRAVPPPPAAPPPPVYDLGARGVIDVPALDGSPLLTVAGLVRGRLVGDDAVATVLDARVTSQNPAYDVGVAAGRVVYEVGGDRVRFDRELAVWSPARRAGLRAVRAEYALAAGELTVPERSLLTAAGLQTTCEWAVASLDLRQVRGQRLRLGPGGARPAWSATAATGVLTADRRLTLTDVAGAGADGATFSAPTGVWDPQAAALTLSGGVRAAKGAQTLTCPGAVWRPAAQRLEAVGGVRLAAPGVTARGGGGQVALAAGQATLTKVSATAGRLGLRAASATVGRDQRLVLTNVEATDAERGVTLTAPRADYDTAAQRLVLAAGGRARRGEHMLRADRVEWTPADGVRARGNVCLEGPGLRALGATGSAPSDLRSATLTPVDARGSSDRGRWRLQAATGRWTADGGLALTATHGEFHARERQATARAGAAHYDPAQRKVYFRDGFHGESASDDLVVDARGGTYDVGAQVFTLAGEVRAKVRGVSVRDRAWTWRLGGAGDEPIAGSGEPDSRSPAPAGETKR